jgi:PAS domain S-box-containing protein
MDYWLADFILQFLAILLIALRGILPDWVSTLFGVPMILVGALLLYMGLERYVGKMSPQRYNFILVAGLTLVHAYFVFVQPSLQARNIIFSVGLLVICAQCAWLMLRRVDNDLRPDTARVGIVFGIYSLVSIARLFADLAVPQANDLFKSGLYDTLAILIYQMLFIGLTFALFLMVNRRLFSALQHDIAERKRAEEAILASKAKLEAALASMTDAVFISDTEGRFIDFNDAFATFHKFRNKDECAKTLAEYPEFLDMFMASGELAPLDQWAVPRALRGETGTNIEYTLRRKDTGETWVGSYSFAPIRDEAGVIVGSVVAGRDITERKQAEVRIRKLNRVYAVLGDINQAIVRIREPQALFEKVCRIAVEVGGFHMAWIGLVDEAARQVQVAAQAGVTDAYLEAFGVAWRDEPIGSCPVKRALRNEQHAMCNLIGRDVPLAACQQMAFQLGLRSSAAFPLRVFDQIRGTINFYSAEPDYFDVEEIQLLDELAMDVSYAMEFAAKEAERKRAEEALRASEARYRHTLDAMLEGCQIIGLDWRYLYLNDAADKHNRRPKEELLGRKYMEMWPGIESTGVFAVIRRCMEERVAHSLENAFIFPDGRQGWFDLKIYPVPEGIVILSIDITERKRAEEALRASEERFRRAVLQAPIPMLIHDEEDRNYTLSQGWTKYSGYTLDDIPLMGDWTERAYGERSGFVKEYIDHLFQIDETVSNGEWVINTKDRQKRIWDFYTTPLGVSGDGKRLLLSLAIDITERKRAEDALRASEEQYRSLFEHMVEGFAYCQMIFEDGQPVDWIYLSVNAAFATLTGLKGAVGKRVSEVIPGLRESDPELFKTYARVALTGNPERFETFVEGLKMWFAISVYSPQREFFVAVFDVITDRKRAEEALRDSEQRFKTLFEIAPVGISVLDKERKLLVANDRLERIVRATKEGLQAGVYRSRTYLRADGTPMPYREIPSVRAIDENQPVYDVVNGILTEDGQVIWTRVSAAPLNLPDASVVVITQDITEHKQAEDEIRRLNQELEQRVAQRTAELSDLYNHAPCGYHSLDADGVFVRINDTELQWLGYTREEIIGKMRAPDLFTPSSVETFSQNFSVFKARGWLRDLELELVRKDGSILPVLLNATGIADQDGHYLMSRSTVMDHTDRKRAESQREAAFEAMRVAQAQLEAANKELEAFAYSVSHDLRAPLRAIDGFSRILLEDYGDRLDAEGQRLFGIVRTNAQQMDRLIIDLLALSRVTRGEMVLSRIDMAALAHDVYQEIAAPEVQQAFAVTLAPLPVANGDPTLLRQVWVNLISNAIKYTMPKAERRIDISGETREGMNIYSVKDNGVGFNPDYAHKLFGIFQRLHRADEFEGVGVGLAIVQRIVHRHGGRVWAEGHVGEGATFYFSLPIDGEATA